MSEKGLVLSDGLKDIMKLAEKYKFNQKDFCLLADRMLLLGESMRMIQDLGLFEEISERHKKQCKIASKVLYPE